MTQKTSALEYLASLGEDFLTQASTTVPDKDVQNTLKSILDGGKPDHVVDAAFYLIRLSNDFLVKERMGFQSIALSTKEHLEAVVRRLKIVRDNDFDKEVLYHHLTLTISELDGVE